MYSIADSLSSKVAASVSLSVMTINLPSLGYLKNKNLYQIKSAQRKATELVFREKNIPFRSFKVLSRSEESLGELFTFFMLETILLAEFMKVNPFDQPSVELIKTETKRILKR